MEWAGGSDLRGVSFAVLQKFAFNFLLLILTASRPLSLQTFSTLLYLIGE